jgi:CRP-like cAMP-binding protein
MRASEPRTGDVIVREGEPADALFVVEEGEAEAVATGGDGRRWSLGRLGPGSCFGEIALVLGVPQTAAVVARTPMRLLRLSADAYRRDLGRIDEVA